MQAHRIGGMRHTAREDYHPRRPAFNLRRQGVFPPSGTLGTTHCLVALGEGREGECGSHAELVWGSVGEGCVVRPSDIRWQPARAWARARALVPAGRKCGLRAVPGTIVDVVLGECGVRYVH